MSLSIGIVGLPNVGKSTLFNALVKGNPAEASNYPFCTIDPNVGIVEVPDERLAKLAEIVKPVKITPAAVEFVDIAGLVKNAHQGEGLGNQFLARVREVSAIALVTRFFKDPNIVHIDGEVNPERDIETIMLELIMADLQTVSKIYETAKDQALKPILDGLEKGLPVDEINETSPIPLLTDKPRLYIANIDDNQIALSSEELIRQFSLHRAIETQNIASLLPISAKLESELVNLSDQEKSEFLAGYGLKKSGLEKLIKASYDLLGLQSYFTAGPKEVRAWTIRKGASAKEAAGVIHTDFEKGFIRAEAIAYDDYLKFNGDGGARAAGKMRSEGKDYQVQDGDVIYFRFNV